MFSSPVRYRLGDLEFTWDEDKQRANIRRHGFTFEEAATAWLDPWAIERLDEEHSHEEERWLRIGSSLRGAVLVAWSAERKAPRSVIRIIGARAATRKERRLYAQERGKAQSR